MYNYSATTRRATLILASLIIVLANCAAHAQETSY